MYKIGIDLVEVGKLRRIFAQKDALQESIFTPGELEEARRHRDPISHIAACFALKEALFKALETGMSGVMDWRDVETVQEVSGKPFLRLWGKTAEVAGHRGVVESHVSFAHSANYAAALVVLVLSK